MPSFYALRFFIWLKSNWWLAYFNVYNKTSHFDKSKYGTKLHHTVFYEETLMGYVLKLTITFNGKYLKRYIIYCCLFQTKNVVLNWV